MNLAVKLWLIDFCQHVMYQQFRLFALNLTKKEEKNKLTNFFGVEVPI